MQCHFVNQQLHFVNPVHEHSVSQPVNLNLKFKSIILQEYLLRVVKMALGQKQDKMLVDESVSSQIKIPPRNLWLWLNWHVRRQFMKCQEYQSWLTLIIAIISITAIRKEFLSPINWIYYWRLFCTAQEYYNYLQSIKLIKMERIYKRKKGQLN